MISLLFKSKWRSISEIILHYKKSQAKWQLTFLLAVNNRLYLATKNCENHHQIVRIHVVQLIVVTYRKLQDNICTKITYFEAASDAQRVVLLKESIAVVLLRQMLTFVCRCFFYTICRGSWQLQPKTWCSDIAICAVCYQSFSTSCMTSFVFWGNT